MNSIGIIVNPDKPQISKITKNITEWLKANGKEVIISHIPTERNKLVFDSGKAGVDCAIALGGDGTILHCARFVAELGIPLFGVNLGHLGFLTEIELADLTPSLEKLVSDQFEIEERMMIEAKVLRHGKDVAKFICLNDAVITKGAFSRLIRLKVFVNGEYVDIYPADGIIVSTPTGSTAYSLSAGGPLIMPNLELLIITPICPHTLYARPLIIDKNSTVTVQLQPTQAEIILTLDGQNGFRLEPEDKVVIRKAENVAKFIRLNQRTFYEVLRMKMREGGNTDV